MHGLLLLMPCLEVVSTLQIRLLFFFKQEKKYLSLDGLSVEGEENRCGKFSGQEQAVCVDCPFLTTLW